ncbi:MAG: phosphoenolpyruvate carboxykinase (ATP), partial [Gammaproteobacteria bacterium]
MSATIELQTSQVYSDLSPIELIDHAVSNSEGIIAANGALRIITGKRTGRSPLDRFIVKESTTENDIHWGLINRPFDEAKFNNLWNKV